MSDSASVAASDLKRQPHVCLSQPFALDTDGMLGIGPLVSVSLDHPSSP